MHTLFCGFGIFIFLSILFGERKFCEVKVSRNSDRRSQGSRDPSKSLILLMGEVLTCQTLLQPERYQQKRKNYNSKDIGFKFSVNAFFRGLIVTFLVDN